MSLKEKVQNARESDWLGYGLSVKKINTIKKLALLSEKIEFRKNKFKDKATRILAKH